jgi:hypothetical protein
MEHIRTLRRGVSPKFDLESTNSHVKAQSASRKRKTYFNEGAKVMRVLTEKSKVSIKPKSLVTTLFERTILGWRSAEWPNSEPFVPYMI